MLRHLLLCVSANPAVTHSSFRWHNKAVVTHTAEAKQVASQGASGPSKNTNHVLRTQLSKTQKHMLVEPRETQISRFPKSSIDHLHHLPSFLRPQQHQALNMELIDQSALQAAGLAMVQELDQGGFDFAHTTRNQAIMSTLGGSSVLPSAWKTGTTIVGILFKDGVVLGADTRATGGAEVVDKNCEKIHYLAPNIYCCGAGTAADTEKTTELIASNLELLRLSTGTGSRVVTSLTLLKRMLYKYASPTPCAAVPCVLCAACPGVTVWVPDAVSLLGCLGSGKGADRGDGGLGVLS